MVSSLLQSIVWMALRRVHQFDGELHLLLVQGRLIAFCIAETQAIAEGR
jgi:hypothetical protein